jgi:hypothetical protein
MRSTHAADADAYDRRAAAGNVVVSVTVADDSKVHRAIAALEAYDPVDIDESADEKEGCETTGEPLLAEASAGASAGGLTTARDAPLSVPAASTTLPPSETAGDASSREAVIPLAEEQLDVGKRTVDRGTTRIRRYVVEKPVEKSVTLRGEK